MSQAKIGRAKVRSATAGRAAPDGPVLVTGFEPFGGDDFNPSWAVAQALEGRRIADVPVVAQQLPCVFATSGGVLDAALRRHRPRLVIALGLAASRSALSIERVAINLIDARIADNAGAQLTDEPVRRGAKDAYFARLPVKAIVDRLQSAGVPAELSFSAGSFVCNQVFHHLMWRLARRPGVRGGFIHLPPATEHPPAMATGRPMPLAEQIRGVALAIEAALTTADDLRQQGGRID